MPRIPAEKLVDVMKKAELIRHICILAHVDHGKTTIADLLLAANGFINQRQAGSLRYLDDRNDEQERGITMKSSVATLYYEDSDDRDGNTQHLINIIDSPGHIDFTSEVTGAARIADGCLIVVDVIEGIRSQTITAIDIAVKHKLNMILVLNKIDKLILNKNINADELYKHLQQCIEQVNAYVVESKKKEFILQDSDAYDNSDTSESDGVFDPSNCNVIFASAIDGWGFTLSDFAKISADRFDVSPELLVKYLWHDYFYNKKYKKFESGAMEANKRPLVIDIVCENLLTIYKSVLIERDRQKIENILNKINATGNLLKITLKDHRSQLKLIMSVWVPLAKAVFRSIVGLVQPPTNLSEEKISFIIGSSLLPDTKETVYLETQELVRKCDANKDAPVLAYITKIIVINKNQVRLPQSENLSTNNIDSKRKAVKRCKEKFGKYNPSIKKVIQQSSYIDDNLFCGIVRIFSGTVNVGMNLTVLAPDFIPFANNSNFMQQIKVKQLFILLGRDFVPTDCVGAGNIIGVVGFENKLIRSGTLCRKTTCLPLIEPQSVITEPIYRCAIEPDKPSNMNRFLEGVKLLMQTDSCIQCVLQANGQYVLMSAGHIHLEKCLEDLLTYIKMPLKFAIPTVQFRETITSPSRFHISPDCGFPIGIFVCITAYPMPKEIAELLRMSYEVLKSFERNWKHTSIENVDLENACMSDEFIAKQCKVFRSQYKSDLIDNIKRKLNKEFAKMGENWENAANRILAIGDSKINNCLLVNNHNSHRICNMWDDARNFHDDTRMDLVAKCLINAFHQSLSAGPLAEEPLMNIIVLLEHYHVDEEIIGLNKETACAITNSLKRAYDVLMKEGAPALMEPIASTEIVIEAGSMGILQTNLAKCCGKVTSMTGMSEDVFLIKFEVPIIESQEFLNSLRGESQGRINPVLSFSRYEIVPGTKTEGRAMKIISEIRSRKGLDASKRSVKLGERKRAIKKEYQSINYPPIFRTYMKARTLYKVGYLLKPSPPKPEKRRILDLTLN